MTILKLLVVLFDERMVIFYILSGKKREFQITFLRLRVIFRKDSEYSM